MISDELETQIVRDVYEVADKHLQAFIDADDEGAFYRVLMGIIIPALREQSLELRKSILEIFCRGCLSEDFEDE